MNTKYKNLLVAIAQYMLVNGRDSGLDAFLTGYAGQEWTAAKDEAARAQSGAALRRRGNGR